MTEKRGLSSVKYAVRYVVKILDPRTNRKCEVYASSDWELELLLLFLRSPGTLEWDVTDVRMRAEDC